MWLVGVCVCANGQVVVRVSDSMCDGQSKPVCATTANFILSVHNQSFSLACTVILGQCNGSSRVTAAYAASAQAICYASLPLHVLSCSLSSCPSPLHAFPHLFPGFLPLLLTLWIVCVGKWQSLLLFFSLCLFARLCKLQLKKQHTPG